MKALLTIDYHTHILPGIDDGAKDAHDCLQMLKICKAQGVERMIATPHFAAHCETAETFLARRQEAFDALPDTLGISILPGAEVLVERGLSENDKLPELTLAKGKYILLELPYSPLKEWMVAETCNIMYSRKLIPVFAHVDRYLQWYSNDEMHRLLSVRGAVLQINNEALCRHDTLKFAVSLIHEGFPVVFGSDTHNTHSRPPNMEAACKALRSKLKGDSLSELVEFVNSLI